MAEFLYHKVQMSGKDIDDSLQILAALYPGSNPPFSGHEDLYSVIDSTKVGKHPWESFDVIYDGLLQNGTVPIWIKSKYKVWCRNALHVMESQLGNPDYKHEIDVAPKCIFKNGKHQYTDLMSGNWAWQQAVCF